MPAQWAGHRRRRDRAATEPAGDLHRVPLRPRRRSGRLVPSQGIVIRGRGAPADGAVRREERPSAGRASVFFFKISEHADGVSPRPFRCSPPIRSSPRRSPSACAEKFLKIGPRSGHDPERDDERAGEDGVAGGAEPREQPARPSATTFFPAEKKSGPAGRAGTGGWRGDPRRRRRQGLDETRRRGAALSGWRRPLGVRRRRAPTCFAKKRGSRRSGRVLMGSAIALVFFIFEAGNVFDDGARTSAPQETLWQNCNK